MHTDCDKSATVSVILTYHGVPCRDFTDAMRKVMQCMPVREIGRAVDAVGCHDVRIEIGSIAVYEPDRQER